MSSCHCNAGVKLGHNRPNRLTQCCTQFKSPGVKILCVSHLHSNVAFTFKWYGNSWHKTFYSQRVWIGYNIELADWVYSFSRNCQIIRPVHTRLWVQIKFKSEKSKFVIYSGSALSSQASSLALHFETNLTGYKSHLNLMLFFCFLLFLECVFRFCCFYCLFVCLFVYN